MNAKTLTTAALLLFVGAGIVTLAVKESRARAQTPGTAMASEGTVAGGEAAASSLSNAETAAVAAADNTARIEGGTTGDAKTPSAKVVAYYFHGQRRCATCNRIEELIRSALDTHFASEMKTGTVEWLPVNLDEAANRRYIKEFELNMNTLVLEIRDAESKSLAFKRLDRIWQLVRSPEAFDGFVREEMEAYIEQAASLEETTETSS